MSVYQKENPDFLRKSLNSVLIEQSRKPDELVLVEDGPLTEELYQTIQDFKETFPEMKVLPLKENVGLGEALHRGVEACSYDWIARMDTDDIATPDRLQQQVDYIEQHPQLDVLGGNIIEFDTEPDQIVAEKQMPLSHEEIIKRLQRRNPFCHMTVFFKKSSKSFLQSFSIYEKISLKISILDLVILNFSFLVRLGLSFKDKIYFHLEEINL